jgi:hypothetical protein
VGGTIVLGVGESSIEISDSGITMKSSMITINAGAIKMPQSVSTD